jgi:excisionase family DNA binding protein
MSWNRSRSCGMKVGVAKGDEMREEFSGQNIASSVEFERLLDSEQAAELMRLHPETVKRRARRGEIPAMTVGKVWRFRASGLEAYIRNLMR